MILEMFENDFRVHRNPIRALPERRTGAFSLSIWM